MNKKFLTGLVIIGIVFFLGIVLILLNTIRMKRMEKNNAAPETEVPIKNNQKHEDLIRISFPPSGEEVGGEINVTGIARGTWYFEGEFPVELVDAGGNKLTWAAARAQGEWMKEEFVPFAAVLEYRVNETTEAKLILRRNNPSDLREQDMSLEIPVILKPEVTSTQVFFNSNHFDRNLSVCDQVFPVGRVVSETMAYTRQTVEMLLTGPTDREKELGYYSAIPDGVKIQNFDATMPTARIDLSRELFNLEVNTACPKILIQTQIEKTVKAASDAREVIITVDGKPFPGEFPNEGPAMN